MDSYDNIFWEDISRRLVKFSSNAIILARIKKFAIPAEIIHFSESM